MTSESILDFPRDTLSPDVWTQRPDGTYTLRDDVKQKIMQIVSWAYESFKIPEMGVDIIGSITSNCYSKDSDLDLHFNSPKFKPEKAEQFNKIFKDSFKELLVKRPDLAEVNGVEVEVYMQPNIWFDMMSVGCYDVMNDRWIVGPEIMDKDFDPYAKWFDIDMTTLDDVIVNVRSIVLQMYELAIAYLKSHDEDFKEKAGKRLQNSMKKAAAMLEVLKSRRSHDLVPHNAEDAQKERESTDWKKVDSAFKLLGKFGYLSILKQASHAIKHELPVEDAAQELMQTISDRISTQSLVDSECIDASGLLISEDDLDESASTMLKIWTIASLMAMGNVLPAAVLRPQLQKAHQIAAQTGQKFTISSPLVKQAVKNASSDSSRIGDLSKTNFVNAVAKTLWKEARGEDTAGIKAVAMVIWNRADKDPKNVVAVMKEPFAFSCLSDYPSSGWTDKTWKQFVPFTDAKASQDQKNAWKECVRLAEAMADKSLKFTIADFNGVFTKDEISKINSYLNKDNANKKAVDTWGKKCTKKLGKHHFGYLREHDPKYVVPGTMTAKSRPQRPDVKRKLARLKPVYVNVKPNDTLSSIAKRRNTTVQKLIELNGLKNPDILKIGQRIRVA